MKLNVLRVECCHDGLHWARLALVLLLWISLGRLTWAQESASQRLEVLAQGSSLRAPSHVLGQRGGIVYGVGLENLSLALFGYTPGGEVFTYATLPPGLSFADGVLASDGGVYFAVVTTLANEGKMFHMDPAGSLTEIFTFTNDAGAFPGNLVPDLVAGDEGDVFGTTAVAGAYANGLIFHLTADGDYEVMTTFTGIAGARPGNGPRLLRRGPDGTLYGVCLAGGAQDAGTVFKIAPNGNFNTLTTFNDRPGAAKGPDPVDLLLAPDGTLYGVTLSGGAADNGFVFKVPPGGSYSVMAEFPAGPAANSRTLTLGSDGNLYGTTGRSVALISPSTGDIFRVAPNHTLTIMVEFTGEAGERPGFDPRGLVESAGKLYGVASGTFFFDLVLFIPRATPDTIFELAFDGTYRSLGSFLPSGEFAVLQDTLARFEPVAGAAGAAGEPILVGFAKAGGPSRLGSALRIFADGTVEQTSPFLAGNLPQGGIRSEKDGAIYDVRRLADGQGAVLRYGLGRGPQVVTTFPLTFSAVLIRSLADGRILFHDSVGRDPNTRAALNPYRLRTVTPEGEIETLIELEASSQFEIRRNFGNVIEAPDGTLLCAERADGASNHGSLLRLKPDGSFDRPVVFTGTSGAAPGHDPTDLVVASDGSIYGATFNGGASDEGVVFRYRPQEGYELIGTFTGTGGALPGRAPSKLVASIDGVVGGVVYSTRGSNPDFSSGARLWAANASGVTLLGSPSDFTADENVQDHHPVPGGGSIGATINISGDDGGRIFRVEADGSVHTIVDFSQDPVGSFPDLPVRGDDGRYYGTVRGSSVFGVSEGRMFAISPAGEIETLFVFDGSGAVPNLVGPDGDGIIHGTSGSDAQITPTLFRLTQLRRPRLVNPRVVQVNPNRATLAADITPLDSTTLTRFEYGLTPLLGSTTPLQQLARGENAVTLQTVITGLTIDTPYYYRVVTRNISGERAGPVRSFVTASNAPIVLDDTFVAQPGRQAVLSVLANDRDDDPGDPFRIVDTSSPSQGEVLVTQNGSRLAYTGNDTFAGSDTFTYTVEDSFGVQSTATVRVFSVASLLGTMAGRVTAGGFDPSSNGFLQVTLTSTGRMTTNLQWPNVGGSKTVTLGTGSVFRIAYEKRDGSGSVVVTLQLDPENARAIGTVQEGATTATFELLAGDDLPTAPRPDPGIYGAFFEPEAGAEFFGLGGHLVVKTPKKGRLAVFSGRLPDGTKFAGTATLRRGQYELYIPLYRDKKGKGPGGFLRGTLDFIPPPDPQMLGNAVQIQGSLEWSRGEDVREGAAYYPEGIGEILGVNVRRHTGAPPLGNPGGAPDWVITTLRPNATVTLDGGGLGAPIVITGSFAANGKFTPALPIAGFSLTYKDSQAVFLGSFANPQVSARKVTFEGYGNGNPKEARAPFAGATSAGVVTITPLLPTP